MPALRQSRGRTALVCLFCRHLEEERLSATIGGAYALHKFSFGALRIDGSTYEQDVVIDCGEIRKRKKAPSRRFREEFGHTPLSIGEKIPWKCDRLVIGTGAYGRLPVMKEVKVEAKRREVELVIVPTSEAIRLIEKESAANAILHVTC